MKHLSWNRTPEKGNVPICRVQICRIYSSLRHKHARNVKSPDRPSQSFLKEMGNEGVKLVYIMPDSYSFQDRKKKN